MIFARGLTISVFVFILTEPQVIAGGCSGLVETIYLSNTPNGSIYSPGYPNNYNNSVNCLWRFIAPFGSKVLLYFTTFKLEDGSGCNYDSVELYDGRDSFAPLLSRSCGSSLPSPVDSSTGYIYMQFNSDSSVTEKGFVAHYRELTDFSGCPQIVPGASAGVIYSPNFPWNYPNRISCNWTITAAHWWKNINLTFTKFDLEYSYSCLDYVEVKNKHGSQIGKYCGSIIPSPDISSGSMQVLFHSSYWTSDSGFMAFYQIGDSFPTPNPPYWPTPNPPYWTTPNPPYWTSYPTAYSPSKASMYACKIHDQTNIFVASSSSSSITSSSYFDDYYHTSIPYSSCTFKIDTANGYILELRFTEMEIYSCSSCSCGHVIVRDGTSSSSQRLGTYCKSNYRDVVTSNGNHMFVEYHARDRYDNFKATIRSKKAPGVNVPAIVVPIVVAVVLFSIIFVVIKSAKIIRSSIVHEVPLQPLARVAQQPPTIQSPYSYTESGIRYPPQPHAPEISQPSAPDTELVLPPHPEPLATAPHPPLPSSTDYSQGNTNMALAVETE